MELYTPGGFFYFLTTAFHTGFNFYCIICLTVRLFSPLKLRREATNIQVATNLVMAIGVIIEILVWGSLFYQVYLDRKDHLWFGFSIETPNSVTIFLINKLLFWLTGILFFIPKFRKSWLLSFAALIFANFEFIVSVIVRLWKHYLPSGWEIEENNWLFIPLGLLFFTSLSSFLYYFLFRKKKLPYSSVWIR
jgi:hypothetical protein